MLKHGTRPAVCADDRWYPSQRENLMRAVDKYITANDKMDVGEIIGIIAPHAGYFFSGRVAGAAYRQVKGDDWGTVALVGPDHTGVTLGGLAIPDYDTWQTPLGDVPVDTEAVAVLEKSLTLRHVGQDQEHSLEVQLPFLQTALAQFSLLPVIMGDQSPATCRSLGASIAEVAQLRPTLLVASTDLSHFYPDQVARELDEKTLSYVLDFDPEGLAEALPTGKAQACGGAPVAAIMFAARALGARQAHLLRYANSSDVWQDKSRVVGYAAVALTP